MEFEELLVVEHALQINRSNYPEALIRPSFLFPGENWDDTEEEVLVSKPDGSQFRVMAKFSLAHFNIRCLTSTMEDRWRVVVVLKDTRSSDVPEGSVIKAAPSMLDKLGRDYR